MSEPGPDTEARRIATQARDRARFEEDALALADQVYRVARRLVGSREEAEDLVQETYSRAFRSWRSYTPGTNLRAWLFRILTNLNIDRGRRDQRRPDTQPMEENDYYLYNRLESTMDDENPDEERVLARLSQNTVVDALADSCRRAKRPRTSSRRHTPGLSAAGGPTPRARTSAPGSSGSSRT